MGELDGFFEEFMVAALIDGAGQAVDAVNVGGGS
jgi:hypothetical protein